MTNKRKTSFTKLYNTLMQIENNETKFNTNAKALSEWLYNRAYVENMNNNNEDTNLLEPVKIAMENDEKARQTFIDYFTSELTNIKDTPIRNSLGKSKFSEYDLRKNSIK